jgi:hypothetical protein
LLAIADPDENGVDTDLHGSDAYENHAETADYMDDAPAEYNTADQGIEYELQLNSMINRNYNNVLLTTATLPENWGDLAFSQEEHREKLHKVIDDNSEEDDYRDDAPAETNGADNGIEYE